MARQDARSACATAEGGQASQDCARSAPRTPAGRASAGAFAHPGMLTDAADIAVIRRMLGAQVPPWQTG